MKIAAVDFPRFGELPAELREQIWLYCLPERVLELTVPMDHVVFWRPSRPGPSTKWPCKLFHTSKINSIPPLISQVCHEARALCFKNGSTQSASREELDERPPEARWTGMNESSKWPDQKRDIAHLNWTSAYESSYQHTDRFNPLDYLTWAASKLPHGGSLMIGAIDENYGRTDPWATTRASRQRPYPSTLEPRKKQDFDALQKIMPLRAVMKVVVAHADSITAADTGLFGLLADARVQIVDVAETARIQAYFDFAEPCERKASAISPQSFSLESASVLEKRLQNVVLREFGCEELAASIRPAIMFRLCTRDCNRLGYEHTTASPLGLLGYYPAGYRHDHGMLGSREGQERRISRWDREW